MTKQLSLPYSHSWDNFFKGIDGNGPYYRCSFYFPDWGQSDYIANQIMGYSLRSGSTNASGVSINIAGMNHPLSPNLYAVKCDIEGVGPPQLQPYTGFPWYTMGFMAHVEFRPWVSPTQASELQGQSIDPSTPILWCIQSLDFHTETIPSWDHSFTYQSDGSSVPAELARYKNNITVMSLTFPKLPYIPMYWIKTLRNKLNKYTFLGCDPETVLFIGGRTSRHWNTDGTAVQSVELVFENRDYSWNLIPRIGYGPGVWDYAVDSNGNMIYQLADFSPLITL